MIADRERRADSKPPRSSAAAIMHEKPTDAAADVLSLRPYSCMIARESRSVSHHR
jgi:hypothetical protein